MGRRGREYAVLRGGNRRRIGLFGGSFNPPHAGHFGCAEGVRKALKLHEIWWLLTPQNPLKSKTGLQPLAERKRALEALVARSRFHRVSMLIAESGADTTVDFLQKISRLNRSQKLVLVIGSDLMAELPRWHRWKTIARHWPVACHNRPGFDLSAPKGKARQHIRDLTMVWGKRRRLSATQIRSGYRLSIGR